jgi:D-alanyl-D-alanine endopeptidase (penicillin-binding protein 7)
MTMALGVLMLGSLGGQAAPAASSSIETPPSITIPDPLPPITPTRPKHGGPGLKSHAAVVFDVDQGLTLYAKNHENVMPIASITKLMTAIVILDAGLPLEELITIDRADVDLVRHTGSRLKVGTQVPRRELLRLGLMASENRAACALARTFPGGTSVIVRAMNEKALQLGMTSTHFADGTGLDPRNVSSAKDLARLVQVALEYPLIREDTTTAAYDLVLEDGRVLPYINSNGLVKNPNWNIGLSKTGYINEAGRCLVMEAEITTHRVIIVLLDSWGKYTRLGDANRIKKWMESSPSPPETGAL